MTTKLYSIIFLLMLNIIVLGQKNIKLFTSLNYCNYSLSDLKKQQSEVLNGLITENIPAKITDSYPAYFGFKGGFLISLIEKEKSTFSIGPSIQHFSSGGRIHYEDYSGKVVMDQLVNSIGIGAVVQYELHSSSNFDLGLNFTLNYFFSGFENNLQFQVGSSTQSENLEFSSTSFGLEPEIIPSFKIGIIQIGASISYLIYSSSNLEFDDISEAYLVFENGNKVNLEWSGFRIGFYTSLNL